jgi:hypothetical protein
MSMLDTQGKIKSLIERLRQAAQEGREVITEWDHDPYLYDEAANEIERLQAKIEEMENDAWNHNVERNLLT